jgi:hypothetical protein
MRFIETPIFTREVEKFLNDEDTDPFNWLWSFGLIRET